MIECRTYDLVISSDWEYDGDFIALVRAAARARGLSSLLVTPDNLPGTLRDLASGCLDFGVLLDRAAISSPEFFPLQDALRRRGREVLEPVERLRWASDKATMHLELIANGILTPHTIILPSLESCPGLPVRESDLGVLGLPFVIKPANTTGGCLGVVESAFSLFDVERARHVYPRDKYLLQTRVVPAELDGRRAWFRGFYAAGAVLCTWWDDRTHVFGELTSAQVESFGLAPLFDIIERIARICGLRFFSTEIVLDPAGRFLVIDYVNETCDMRLQSVHRDGVPDSVVAIVAERLADFALEHRPDGFGAGAAPDTGGGKTGGAGAFVEALPAALSPEAAGADRTAPDAAAAAAPPPEWDERED